MLVVLVDRCSSDLEINFTAPHPAAKVLDKAATALFFLISNIPGDVLCFLPSYDILDQFYNHIKNMKLRPHIEKMKNIFVEENTGEEVNFNEIRLQLSQNRAKGVLLLGVIDGNYSRNIEFKDVLPKLSASIIFCAGQIAETTNNKGLELFLRRCVPHIENYATVCLFNEIYTGIAKNSLPNWMQLTTFNDFNDCQTKIINFFHIDEN